MADLRWGSVSSGCRLAVFPGNAGDLEQVESKPFLLGGGEGLLFDLRNPLDIAHGADDGCRDLQRSSRGRAEVADRGRQKLPHLIVGARHPEEV